MTRPNRKKEARLTPALLNHLLRYEPDTGRLFWRPRDRSMFKSDRSAAMFRGRFEGREALTATCAFGYKNGVVDGVSVKAHRAIWALWFGLWPGEDIDHIDGDRTNNRISNLREATRGLNCQNRKAQASSTSKYLGVSWKTKQGKWLAQITAGGVAEHLGYHDTEEAAFAAYCEAKARLHPFNPTPREVSHVAV